MASYAPGSKKGGTTTKLKGEATYGKPKSKLEKMPKIRPDKPAPAKKKRTTTSKKTTASGATVKKRSDGSKVVTRTNKKGDTIRKVTSASGKTSRRVSSSDGTVKRRKTNAAGKITGMSKTTRKPGQKDKTKTASKAGLNVANKVQRAKKAGDSAKPGRAKQTANLVAKKKAATAAGKDTTKISAKIKAKKATMKKNQQAKQDKKRKVYAA